MNHLIILAACLTSVGICASEKRKDSVNLTLFYESYCPYSIDFIVDQLYPTWKYFKQHLGVNIVPFGNAQQSYSDGHFHFTCQHGPKECVANILHACAIDEACQGKGTDHCPENKLKKAMGYINCVVQQPDQKAASDKCALKFNLQPKIINKCATGMKGELLESGYGNVTKDYNNPPVTYVPFIVINNKHNKTMQDQAETDLKKLICSYIPKQC